MDENRRNRLDLNTPAELAIYNAMGEVEKIGAEERLTNALIKLKEAKELVANFVEGIGLSQLPPEKTESAEEIKKQLLNRFGFTEDGGVDAENQLKIFSFIKWFAQSHQVSQVTATREQLVDFLNWYYDFRELIFPEGHAESLVDTFLSGQIPAKDKTEQSNCIQCGKLVSKFGKLCDECNCK